MHVVGYLFVHMLHAHLASVKYPLAWNASVTHPAATQFVLLGIDRKCLSIKRGPMLSGFCFTFLYFCSIIPAVHIIPKHINPTNGALMSTCHTENCKSVNNAILKELCSITIDDAVQKWMAWSSGTLLAKVNIKNAFRLLATGTSWQWFGDMLYMLISASYLACTLLQSCMFWQTHLSRF